MLLGWWRQWRTFIVALAVGFAGIYGFTQVILASQIRDDERIEDLQRQMPQGCTYQQVTPLKRSPIHLIVCDVRVTTSLNWSVSSGKTSKQETMFVIGVRNE